MSVKKRLKAFIKSLDITNTSFEKSIGASNGYINSISQSIGREKLETILEKYPKLNSEWLLTGNGNMIKSNDMLSNKNVSIPLIPIDAMAGFGTGEMQVMDYECDHYMVPEFDELNVEFLIKVRNDSMMPRYNSGDIVGCKKINLDSFIQWNKIYVLDTNQGAIIKRLRQSELKDHVLCVSDNKQYDPFDLPKSEIHSLAIVLGHIGFD